MDAVTLVTTAIALASPFLLKSGEAMAEKIGEDLWNVIKKPFVKSGEAEVFSALDYSKPENLEKLKGELALKLKMTKTTRLNWKRVQTAQTQLNNYQQNIMKLKFRNKLISQTMAIFNVMDQD